MTTLEQRLLTIERKVFGDNPEAYVNPDIKNRLNVLQKAFDSAENSIPDHAYCKQNAIKYNIFLQEKRVSTLQMNEKAELIYATKYEIEKNLNMLSIIQDTMYIADSDIFEAVLESKYKYNISMHQAFLSLSYCVFTVDNPDLIDRIYSLEKKIQSQFYQISQQTTEIDFILEQYENLVSYLLAPYQPIINKITYLLSPCR